MPDSVRVFILEDDVPTRESLERRLTLDARYAVAGAAGTLAEARLLLQTTPVDVLLVDLQLPDGNAIGLIRERTELAPTIPILVISVFGDEERVIGAIEAGARGYLLKDDSGEELVDSIHRVRNGESPISPAIARHLIRRFQPSRPIEPAAESIEHALSEREMEVLRLASKGLTYQETATALGVTVNTVGTYTRRIYTKLAVSSRAQALFEARQLGLMGGDE
ncbi:MAG: response regulator transcription factor [Pseudomonadota bacterium]